ncbi:PREDICTED: dirigent protein 11 [Ipomoea nil]|uniref:dirigent protein 11 n=1 Tax=Ipomoea nil TaxID=35883 RepID=UPI000900FA8E|nr:PREDICTED: dirigent protein 11 [Ipomoea nil]
MLSKIIFCTAVFLAAIAVLLLALFSPIPHKNNHPSNSNSPMLALSLYIQQPNISYTAAPAASAAAAGALIFHRILTEGPENTSRVVGKAQGFIVPLERFAHSAFNIIYLTVHTGQFSGSLSIQAENLEHKDKEEEKLSVVGGTGSFAFARGLAVFAQTDELHATFHVKLHLEFPNTIPR